MGAGVPLAVLRRASRCVAGAALVLGGTLVANAQAVDLRGDAIVFDGRIDAASTDRFLALLATAPVTRLVITSGGGLVGPALRMAEAVFARGLDVEIPERCHSSCANYVFPAGRRKFLGHPDAVGWHGNMAHVLWRAATGQEQWSAAQLASARELAEQEGAFFQRIGVDGFVCWFAKLPPDEVPTFYWLSVEDMALFGIRDVTVTAGEQPAVEGGPQRVRVDWTSVQARRPSATTGPVADPTAPR